MLRTLYIAKRMNVGCRNWEGLRMVRSLLRATACLLALGASGATFTVDVSDAKIYAKEVFGAEASNVVVDYDDEAPKITLSIGMVTATEAMEVDDGDTTDITFTLANARFARNVRLSSLQSTNNAVDIVRTDDGRRDDSSVTFRIEADGDLPLATSTITTVSFEFAVPELTGLNTSKPVTATVAVDSGGGSGWPRSDAASTVAGTDTGLDDGNLRALGPMPMTGERPTKPLISFADGLRFAVGGSGGTRMIDVSGGRTDFTTDGAAVLGTVTLGLETAADCEDPPSSDCVLQPSGDPFSIARRQDGEGDLIVTSAGDFRAGDMVWLDADGSKTAQASEMLTMDDGVASGTFDIADLAGDSRAARGSVAREEGIATNTLYYAPNGEDGLRPSEYRSRFSVDFQAAGNADKPEQESRFETMYATTVDPSGAGEPVAIEATRTAGSVPALTATDVGNLRIKCEVSSPCVIHLECDDVNGETWFARLDEPIPGRATLHLTAADIAEALGISVEEGWDDSLSCAILGSRDISVQVLTRTGGVLVNHTYVESD